MSSLRLALIASTTSLQSSTNSAIICAGDIWVRGSRQFREFDDYLIPPAAWAAQKQTDEWTLAAPRTFTEYLDQQRTALHEQLTIVNDQLAAKTLPDVTLRNGKLRLTRLEKAVPDDIEEFTRRV